jgi:DNA-binding protein YbaB
MELTGQLAEYERIGEQVRGLRDGIADIRATAYSDDGLVTAVAGGRGELLELSLDPRVYRDQDAGALADAIRATVRDAAEQAGRQAAKLAKRLLPPNTREDDVDPMFDPALHLLGGTEPGRGKRSQGA